MAGTTERDLRAIREKVEILNGDRGKNRAVRIGEFEKLRQEVDALRATLKASVQSAEQ